MINLQDFIIHGRMFKKFKVDNLLFTEFKCPLEGPGYIWWHTNFFTYVVTGEIMLQTSRHTYFLKPGDCAFAKRGSVITRTLTHEDFALHQVLKTPRILSGYSRKDLA